MAKLIEPSQAALPHKRRRPGLQDRYEGLWVIGITLPACSSGIDCEKVTATAKGKQGCRCRSHRLPEPCPDDPTWPVPNGGSPFRRSHLRLTCMVSFWNSRRRRRPWTKTTNSARQAPSRMRADRMLVMPTHSVTQRIPVARCRLMLDAQGPMGAAGVNQSGGRESASNMEPRGAYLGWGWPRESIQRARAAMGR